MSLPVCARGLRGYQPNHHAICAFDGSRKTWSVPYCTFSLRWCVSNAGKPQGLSPIAVTVEIKTGKRRVIEYFLSPLLQYGNESLRER